MVRARGNRHHGCWILLHIRPLLWIAAAILVLMWGVLQSVHFDWETTAPVLATAPASRLVQDQDDDPVIRGLEHWKRTNNNINRHRTRSVVLLGPHDRFNFGDLLFEKVASKLLQIRAGYRGHQLLRAGLVSVNTSAYGGPPNIMSLDVLQKMSHAAVRKGQSEAPYDIVYLGGQAMGCPWHFGMEMIADYTRKLASAVRVSDCAYLLPKHLLVPPEMRPANDENDNNNNHTKVVSKQTNVHNRAVVNSVGGSGFIHVDCGEAARTADYVAFRDLPDTIMPATAAPTTSVNQTNNGNNATQPMKQISGRWTATYDNDSVRGFPQFDLRPDSAIMTRELYHDVIDRVVRETPAIVHLLQQTKGHYIAVQHKIHGLTGEPSKDRFAHALVQVSRNMNNATLVFFVAGTAAHHDSLDLYEDIQERVRMLSGKSIVFRGEHVWQTVAIASRASVVLSSSLHVRIMAFIFFKPRGTWCTEPKHENFLKLWDTRKSSSPCIAEYDDTWNTVREYVGPHPKIGQAATMELYRRFVDQYMEGFDKWSSILDT